MSLDFVGAFTIREIAGAKRTLRLSGRALPFRPLSLTGGQRHDITWQPGNPKANMQIFGADEKPTTIRGFWHEPYIVDAGEQTAPAQLDGEPVTSVKDLADVVDDIRRKGSAVEVLWLHEKREGLIAEFKKDWHDLYDLEWEVQFVWTSHGDESTTIALSSYQANASDMASRFGTKADDVSDNSAQFLVAPPQYGDGVLNAVDRFTAVATELAEASTKAADGVLDAPDSAKRIATSFEAASIAAKNLITSIYAFPDRVALNVADIASIPVGQAIATSLQNRDLVRAARESRHEAARNRELLLREVDPELLSTFVARENADLRDVSTRFYGQPGEWRNLMTYNALSSSRLRGGQVVFVPRIARSLV